MIKRKSSLTRLIYFARDLRAKKLYKAIDEHCTGDVLDIGGGNFFAKAKERFKFESWTSLEPSKKYAKSFPDKRYKLVIGDGQQMKLKSNSFDTVLCIQVLEHVLEPMKVMSEISRVLKKEGKAILLIPQTANIHMVPDFYSNLSKYWIKKAAKINRLKIIDIKPLGGFWSSVASRFVFYFLQSLHYQVVSDTENRRNWFFYLTLPFQWFFALISILISMIFSFGDLSEEPNNHLVVLKK